jgi:hypothetical protein
MEITYKVIDWSKALYASQRKISMIQKYPRCYGLLWTVARLVVVMTVYDGKWVVSVIYD